MQLLIQKIKNLFSNKSNIKQLHQIITTSNVEIGQTHLKEHLFTILQCIKDNKKASNCFIFIGNEGLGKTVISRDLVTKSLFQIKRIKYAKFIKVNFQDAILNQEINSILAANKDGVIHFTNVNTDNDVAFVNNLKANKTYAKTAFVLSISNELFNNFSNTKSINQFHTIEFKPYTNAEMAKILVDNIIGCSKIQLNVQDTKSFVDLIAQLKDHCNKLNIPFEYVSTVNFFFYKCFIKASLYLHASRLDNRLVALSLKNFERFSNR
jgi:hypothetical protein